MPNIKYIHNLQMRGTHLLQIAVCMLSCDVWTWLKVVPYFPCRLRKLLQKAQTEELAKEDLIKNLQYAAAVLETVYIDETR